MKRVALTLTRAELSAVREALECPLSGDEDDAAAVFGPPQRVQSARSALRAVRVAIAAAERK